jgi:hypothetical protein
VSTDHERQVALNEARFRSVNEQIEESAVRTGLVETGYGFVCECGDADCTAHLPISIAEYEEVRTESTQFAIVPGHQRPSIELLINRSPRYLVVRKEGEAAELAIETDPRS